MSFDAQAKHAIARCEASFRDGSTSRGTAFLVSKDLVLTAMHVVAQDRIAKQPTFADRITLVFTQSGFETAATILKDRYDGDADWVLLRCANPPAISRPLKFAWSGQHNTANWQTFGYPAAEPENGMAISGSVRDHHARRGTKPAIQLFSEEAAAGNGMPAAGLSGAPVIVNGKVIGHLRRALVSQAATSETEVVGGTLYACPIGMVYVACADLLPRLDTPVTLGIFDPPSFSDAFERSDVGQEMATALKERPVVSVEGLSGSGKTYFVSTHLKPTLRAGNITDVYWHNPESGELLDRFIEDLAKVIPIDGAGPTARCKTLLHHLRETGSVLVIDDYQIVDQISFGVLLKVALESGSSAVLILISRSLIQVDSHSHRIGRVEIPGLDSRSAVALLAQHNIRGLDHRLVGDLLHKTDGLPFAITLFALLVSQDGHAPEELLEGSMMSSERLQRWYEGAAAGVDSGALTILRWLAVVDGPFNWGFLKALAVAANVADYDASFAKLQKRFLIQRYSHYRWRVHNLVAIFALAGVNATERRPTHAAIGKYYLRGINTMSEAEATAWLLRACKHLQLADKSSDVQNILARIASAAKRLGLYSSFIQLCKQEVAAHQVSDPWLTYHYVHCCLIVGRFRDAYDAIEPLRAVWGADRKLSLAVARLHAELAASRGDNDAALSLIQQALASVQGDSIGREAVSHAMQVKGWLLTRKGDFDEAHSLLERLLADAARASDKRGSAIMMGRLGSIARRRGMWAAAARLLESAEALFGDQDVNDLRGRAWVLLELALVELRRGHESAGNLFAKKAIVIKAEIEECSIDYREQLDEVLSLLVDKNVQRIAKREFERVTMIFRASMAI